MSLVCSLTSEIAVDPVVTPSGNVYERRVIEKHIQATGTDPVSKQPLAVSDLIGVKVTPNPAAARPRTGAQHSIPGLLGAFQSEWDALMLECFNLKQQLQTTRQELSQALYQQDAARRVIARLLKEKEQLKQDINNVRATAGTKTSGDAMDVEGLPGLSAELKAKITQTSKELMGSRPSRQPSPSLIPKSSIQQFKNVTTVPPHKSTAPGVLCLDIFSGADKDHLTITGGVDATAVIYNKQTEKKEAVLTGHVKPVIGVKFHNRSDQVAFTASQDGTAKAWRLDASTSKWNTFTTFSAHTGALSGLDVHATGDLIGTSSVDRSWALHDITAGATVVKVVGQDIDLALTSLRFHPDGVLFATGGDDSLVRAWDIRSSKQMASFEGHAGKITDVTFNENGFYLVTAAEDKTLKLWDLRNLKQLASVTFDEVCSSVAYDYSGKYLAAAVGSEIRVFTRTVAPKEQGGQTTYFDFVNAFGEHTKKVTGVKWGQDARFLASTSMDRNLKFWAV